MAAEAAGIDMVWVAEAYGFDAVSMLGYLAAKTERIGLGSGILPLGTRTPALLAMTAEGWLPMFGFFPPDRWRDVWGEPLDRGLAKRAPELGPLDIIAGGEIIIGPDGESHRERARNLISLYVGGMGSREQNFY